LNSFDLIIVPGKSIESILKLWNLKTVVKKLSNAVVPHENDYHKNKEIQFDFLVVSRLVKWKRVDLAIKIAANLQKSIAVIGLGPELDALENYAETLGARVYFLGSQTQDEIYEISKNCFSFIQMSEYEGMSYSMLEAMNVGLLVICSNIQANRDVITHLYDGFLIDLNNIDASCDELNRTFLNTNLIFSMISNAKMKIDNEHNMNTQIKFFENFVTESTN
jgi:glycosyltransferase involved in cell wall biosynthesis